MYYKQWAEMYRKCNEEFSTTHYRTLRDVVKHIRAVKHIMIASVPANQWLTVYDYDKVKAVYAN